MRASELLRIVAIDHGADQFSVMPDPARRLPGRGAHLHPDPACLASAERRRAFGRALRVAGVIDTGSLIEAVSEMATSGIATSETADRVATAAAAGTADGGRIEPHPDTQSRTTDMSTR